MTGVQTCALPISAVLNFTLFNESQSSFIENVSNEYVKVSIKDLFRSIDGDILSGEGVCASFPVAATWNEVQAKVSLSCIFLTTSVIHYPVFLV